MVTPHEIAQNIREIDTLVPLNTPNNWGPGTKQGRQPLPPNKRLPSRSVTASIAPQPGCKAK